jgi:hypothetical protein
MIKPQLTHVGIYVMDMDKMRAAGCFFEHFRAHNTSRHQIWRELNPFVGQPQHRAQGFHQTGFGQAGHANQQGVAARQQSDQGFIYYRFLSKDDPTGHLPDPGDTFYRHLDVSDQLFVGFADR